MRSACRSPASIARSSTATRRCSAAILKLVETGKLRLHDKPFRLLNFAPPSGKSPDPVLWNITIRELLQHTGGWDRDKSFDPMFIPIKAALAVGAPAPATC